MQKIPGRPRASRTRCNPDSHGQNRPTLTRPLARPVLVCRGQLVYAPPLPAHSLKAVPLTLDGLAVAPKLSVIWKLVGDPQLGAAPSTEMLVKVSVPKLGIGFDVLRSSIMTSNLERLVCSVSLGDQVHPSVMFFTVMPQVWVMPGEQFAVHVMVIWTMSPPTIV